MTNSAKITIGVIATIGVVGGVYFVVKKRSAPSSVNGTPEPQPAICGGATQITDTTPSTPTPPACVLSSTRQKAHSNAQATQSSSSQRVYSVDKEDISKALDTIIKYMKQNGGNVTDIANLQSLYDDAVVKNDYKSMESALTEGIKSIQFWARSIPLSSSIRYSHLMSAITKPIKLIHQKVDVIHNTDLMLNGMTDLLKQRQIDGYYGH